MSFVPQEKERSRTKSSATAPTTLPVKTRTRAQSEQNSAGLLAEKRSKLLATKTRKQSLKKNVIGQRTSEIYEKGSKFKRLSSGRVCPTSRTASGTGSGKGSGNASIKVPSSSGSSGTSGRTNEDAKSFVKKMRMTRDNNQTTTSSSGSNRSSSNNLNNLSIPYTNTLSVSPNSSEMLLFKQSFNSKVSQLSAPQNVMRISPTTEKNSVLLRRVPSPESTLSILRDDIVVRHLVGEYNLPDRYAFAEKIAEEIQGLGDDLNTESMIEFLLSDEYKYWLKVKTAEWINMPSNKRDTHYNKRKHSNHSEEWRNVNSNVNATNYLSGDVTENVTQYLSGYQDDDGIAENPWHGKQKGSGESGSSIIQIFQDCGGGSGEGGEHCVGVHNHYNYEIKINTRGKPHIGCFGKSCCIL